MINARAETVDEKASFKKPLKDKRCLVLTNGFYEWKKVDSNTKIPVSFYQSPPRYKNSVQGLARNF